MWRKGEHSEASLKQWVDPRCRAFCADSELVVGRIAILKELESVTAKKRCGKYSTDAERRARTNIEESSAFRVGQCCSFISHRVCLLLLLCVVFFPRAAHRQIEGRV